MVYKLRILLPLISKLFKWTPISCLLDDALPISRQADLLRLPIALSLRVSHDNPLVLLADLQHLWVLRVLPLYPLQQCGTQLLYPGDILVLTLHHGLKPVDPLLLLRDDLLEPLVLLGNHMGVALL